MRSKSPKRNTLATHSTLMKIRYLTNLEIDYTKWDQCIDEAVNGIAYGYSWYLDIFAPSWNALVFGDYEMVMPLHVKKKLHVTYVLHPFFIQQLGVFSIHPFNQQIVQQFLEAIPSHISYINCCLNEGNDFPIKNFTIINRPNYLLFLNKSYDKLYENYDKNTKRNVKKAQKTAITFYEQVSPEDMLTLYKTQVGYKLTHLKEKHYEQLLQLMYQTIHKGVGEIKGVYDENNELCSAGFFIHTHDRIINLLPASNDIGKKHRAMFFILDQLIRAYANTYLILDFEGSMIPSIARFYKGFGAKEVVYPYLHKNKLPWYLRWFKR